MAAVDPIREKGLQDYRKKLLEHKEVESRLKERKSISMRMKLFVFIRFAAINQTNSTKIFANDTR